MVFITGATGLLGARLVYELHKDGCVIKALFREKDSIEKLTKTLSFYTNNPEEIINAIQWVQGNVLDLEILLNNIELEMDVYHCAAFVSFNAKDKQKITDINVQGTANLVNACLEKKVRKLCHVSSIGALGTPVNGSQTDVDSAWSPLGKSVYSISKHNSELEVWRGIAEGLNAVIVNPAVILGKGDWENSSAMLFKRVAKGMNHYTLGSTGFVDVEDVASVMVMLMNSDISEQQFILSAETLSYKELFSKIAEALNVNAPKKKASEKITSLAWRIEFFRTKLFGGTPKINKNTHKIAHSKSSYNGLPITKAISFNYTSINKTIAIICNAYKTQHPTI